MDREKLFTEEERKIVYVYNINSKLYHDIDKMRQKARGICLAESKEEVRNSVNKKFSEGEIYADDEDIEVYTIDEWQRKQRIVLDGKAGYDINLLLIAADDQFDEFTDDSERKYEDD